MSAKRAGRTFLAGPFCAITGKNYICIMVQTNTALTDPHSENLISQYRSLLLALGKMSELVVSFLKSSFDRSGLIVAALEHRIKTEESLRGKLALKGSKYNSIYDVTDILGIRVITFYIDDVDKVASLLERHFDIDWENSVDKRKLHEIDSFGYLSLHYICRVPESLFSDPSCPGINNIRFEVQMRTVLQHAWANMNHDTGYKSGVEIPKVYLRNLSRLAGMLELVDDEFSRIRRELADYRRRVQSLVASGNLDEVQLDGDSFRSYLTLKPFDPLMRRIASLNQAEIQEVDLSCFLPLFKGMGFKTIGQIDSMVRDFSEAAYQIACFQIGLTDIDILSSSVAPQNLCMAYILHKGGGRAGLKYMLDTINGPLDGNEDMARFLEEQTKDLPFMNQ